MKALDLYNFFKQERERSGEAKAITKLLVKMMEEVELIRIQRGAMQTTENLVGIIYEQNNKWNAMIKWDPLFKRNGFAEFIKLKIPPLTRFLKKRGL